MNNFDLLLEKLTKWKFHLAAIILISGIISFIITFLIQSEYQSFAILYPVNIGQYSEESHSEQMIQILKSKDIKDSVLNKFNLVQHYKIDTNNKKYLDKLYNMYDNNIDIQKTKYESVKISCKDKDPKIAAKIINAIIHFYNIKAEKLYNTKIQEVKKVAQGEIIRWSNIKDSLNNILKKYREQYGIQNYSIQLVELTKGLYKTNDKTLKEETKKLLKYLAKYGQNFESTHEYYKLADGEYKKAILAYNAAVKEYNKKISYTQIISEPFISYKKIKTKQILIITLSIIFSFFITIIIISIIEIKNK